MPDSNLPASALAAIEQRVKRRIRRQVIMVALTLTWLFSAFMSMNTYYYEGGRYWGMAAAFFLVAWIVYGFWFVYHALVERGIRREIERERQHQLRLAREGGRIKRGDRFAHLAGPEDDPDLLLADDGELWIEDELLAERKPKRRLDS